MAKPDEGQQRKLLKQYRVFYDLNERRAPGHEDYFEDIQTLGEHNFDEYRSNVTIESRHRPWRQKILSRAKAISAKARRCLEANKNEASWRLSIESEVLARFGIEVICSVENLAARQKTRQPCRCPSRKRGEDQFDEGLNPLFDDRADEEIEHESEVEKILKKGKKPDRLLGLRVTGRLDRILNQTEGPEGNLIGDSVKTSPFKDGCEPLLFPFLVLEAKSEKSPDAFSKINLQTGFAIRALLKLQRDLICATIENQHSGMTPLVWFLSYKGETWRLSGAYVEETKDASEPNYRILELWEGNITYEHHSLRLLLILDYIFDWARDVYRKDIIGCLLSLATNSTPSLAADTDVYSTVGHFMDVDQLQEFETTDIMEQTEPFDVPQLLKFFDTADLAFRDARYMCHKLCALHLTLENLDKFLYSVSSMRESKQLARRLWRSILGSSAWSLTADCLNALEKLWTGKERELQVLQNPEQRFLVSFEIKSYFSSGEYLLLPEQLPPPGQWDQFHELTYIAIAHDALQALRERTKFSANSLRLRIEDCPNVSQKWVIDHFERIRFAPLRMCFAAAICRCCMYSSSLQSSKGDEESFAAGPDTRGRIKYFVPHLATDGSLAGPGLATLPGVMYRRLKIGMTEPSETFLRVSQQFGKHDPKMVCSKRWEWPKLSLKTLQGIDALLLYAMDARKGELRYCIFTLDLPPMNISEGRDTVTDPGVFPRRLRTFLNRPLGSDGIGNQIVKKSKDLSPALRILEHISTQYQLVHSLDRGEDFPLSENDWILEKHKILSSWAKAKWPYTLLETVDGIQRVGESYGFGRILQCLATAFQKLVKYRTEVVQLAKEMGDLKRIITSTKSPARNTAKSEDRVDRTLNDNATATGSITCGPAFTRRSRVDSPEFILIEDGSEEIEGRKGRRKRSISSSNSDSEDSEAKVTKKRRPGEVVHGRRIP